MLKIGKILYTEEQIIKKIELTAKKINKEFKGKELTLLCLLKGSTNFLYELSKRIEIPHKIAYILAKSYYGGHASVGKTSILSDIDFSIEGDELIIVEDIIDSGRTLKTITEHIETKNPKNTYIYTLLDKPSKRSENIKVDNSCFVVGDKFLVGFGLDYQEKYRNLPYIAEATIIDEEE